MHHRRVDSRIKLRTPNLGDVCELEHICQDHLNGTPQLSGNSEPLSRHLDSNFVEIEGYDVEAIHRQQHRVVASAATHVQHARANYLATLPQGGTELRLPTADVPRRPLVRAVELIEEPRARIPVLHRRHPSSRRRARGLGGLGA
eukprot:CAMPEP_0203929300 /NCGR_PEP_ID=MMETSP0359-20131031/68251_1 /ASSEMBLY_ACC=CAM_ASM_000338 /TAXON_ID=268821 /ORGANISM="Scrippsiella Hangoei, Strain SHTV-5" /LENGTH=144 /DNA_ID=CAMNT_0050858311 /DNA_START=293 /DNA_END=723 /DNA_ORIENTATION=-